MSNGVSFVNVLVTDEYKMQYKIALAKEGMNMKTHIISCMDALIEKHQKEKKKK